MLGKQKLRWREREGEREGKEEMEREREGDGEVEGKGGCGWVCSFSVTTSFCPKVGCPHYPSSFARILMDYHELH